MSNLEDFFSKKDSKKSKKTSEYLAAEELYRTLEESTKFSSEFSPDQEVIFPSEELDSASVGGVSAPLKFGIRFSDEAHSEEDEWSDFTEENRRKFTNVPRPLPMALISPAPAPAPFVGGDLKAEPELLDTGGDGIDVGSNESALATTTCPWQKSEQSNKSETAKQNEQSVGRGNPPVAKKQIYIPPALRQSQEDFNKRKEQQQPRQRKGPCPLPDKPQAPDLNSLEYFPSLSGSKILKRPK